MGGLLGCFITAAMLAGGAINGQAATVIANAGFEDTIPGTNKPADWTDVGGNVLAMSNNGGRLNLSLPNAARTLSPTTFRGAAQNVDLTDVHYLIFDAGSPQAQPDWVEIVVRIDGDELWSASLAGTYSDQTIDVSGYVGVHTLSLQIQSVVSQVTQKPSGIAASFHFDNLRTVKPDTTPPTVALSVAEDLLWPPNHKMVDVGLSVSAQDDSDPNPAVQVFVYSSEPDNGTGDGDAAIGVDGALALRAERSGGNYGRVYLVIVTATDAAGNVGYDCRTAVVPHDKGRKSAGAVVAEAAIAEQYCHDNGTALPGYNLIGGSE